MSAVEMIMQARQQDVNPFREMLKQMGAFSAQPNLNELGGVQPTANPGQGEQLRQMVAKLIAKGMPQEEAIAQAKQMLGGRG